MIEEWRQNALKQLSEAGASAPKSSMMDRLKRRTPEHKIITPDAFLTIKNAVIIFFAEPFSKGSHRLAIPEIEVTDGKIYTTDTVHIFNLTCPQDRHSLHMVHDDELCRSVLPRSNARALLQTL